MFRGLVNEDPAKLMRYKNFLDSSELGYRVQTSLMIDRYLEKAHEYFQRDKVDDAFRMMEDLRSRVLNDSLGYTFRERIDHSYQSLLQKNLLAGDVRLRGVIQ